MNDEAKAAVEAAVVEGLAELVQHMGPMVSTEAYNALQAQREAILSRVRSTLAAPVAGE